MNCSLHKHVWRVLCWNIRGINAEAKWNAIKSKINESACDIVCLQETKREFFDNNYVNFFCPGRIDNFEFIPSLGASGGSIIVWNGSKFSGSLAFQNEFSQYFELTCLLTGEQWFLTNIYVPCIAEGKLAFLRWFRDMEIQGDSKWLIVGDLNLIISQENRN
jgi:exonuclease III